MGRLIDADVLIHRLKTAIDLGKKRDRVVGELEAVLNDVESMSTIDAEPHWIPCSERMPEKDGYYLTTTCYRQVYCDFWSEDHFDRTEAVIAWMPLPKPYEVEDEKVD